MAKKQFKLPSVSPLIGSKMSVFRNTISGREVEPQYKKVARNTKAVINVLAPFRSYEKSVIDSQTWRYQPENLVFIVGHWRSGTTFLHNLMCQAKDATFVSTYQTVFANYMGSQPIIKPFMRLVMPERRPADNVRLGADLPQEEEFAFSNVNPHTYYRYMYFPKDYRKFYNESVHFDGLSSDEIDRFEQDYKDVLAKALMYRPGNIMVVKNPVHTARLPWLHKTFPDARFIHIHRSPYEVFRSTMRFFSSLLPTLWFHQVSEEFLRDMIFDVYNKLYLDFDMAIAQMPGLRLTDVRYSDLLASPVAELRRIYQELDLPGFAESEARFISYSQKRKSHKIQQYDYSGHERELIEDNLGTFIDRWGYHLD